MGSPAHSFNDGAAYELFMGGWSRAVGRLFLEWVASPAGGQWLDVGCGTGVLTELILEQCAPAGVDAVDPSPAQIDYASGCPRAQQARFSVADALALPFAESSFDVVASALVLNFVADLPRGLAEMRRVARPTGTICAYVWDFGAELSPSGAIRRGLRQIGVAAPEVPGTEHCDLAALCSLFHEAGMESVAVRSFDVNIAFPDFDSYWRSQAPSYSPTTKVIAGLSLADRKRLIDAVLAELSPLPDGTMYCAARANAIKAEAPAREHPS
jgi:SAM-dependent methyltransferase